MTMLAPALELAEAGWPVFPLTGKAPLTVHGFRDASCDASQIRLWWERWPRANIGIAVPKGMVVVDVDPRDGGNETLAELERRHGHLPPTLEVSTGSGGRHLWFKHPTDRLLQRDLGAGVQTRVGGKGYVVAPPSVHPETGRPYQWVQPAAPVAWLPSWVVAKLHPPKPAEPGQRPKLTVLEGGAKGWLDRAHESVRTAPQGQGHVTLRSWARAAGGYIAAGQLDENMARRVLVDAAASWENKHKTAASTVDTAIEHGKKNPLRWEQ
jgi:Bifunctional DNA primase/polymerase, N-terminal